MSDISPKLALPFIQPSQAQKHVTHNEAIQRLDVLVQLVVKDSALTLAPAIADEGDSYIVAPGATGVWAGHDAEIATFRATGWEFIAPKAGWSAQVLAQDARLVYGDSGWVGDGLAGTAVVDQLGISGTPDATNRLSVSSPATLLNHAGGGHQLKLNKAAPGDTASLLFQSGFSGRAELGLAGEDGWSLKVSADGTTWKQALHVDPASDMVSIAPAGIPRVHLGDSGVEIDVPVTGAAVQSNPQDATPGRLMKTAAFGWGADDANLEPPPGNDFNALRITGFWRATGSETGAPPFAAAVVQHMVRLSGTGSEGRHLQIAYDATSPQGAVRRMLAGGGWAPWQMTRPTGGTNANGTYVRLPTGTQIAWRTITANSGADVTWTYPAAFSAPPLVFGGGQLADRILTSGGTEPTTTAAKLRCWLLSSNPVRSSSNVSAFAIGPYV